MDEQWLCIVPYLDFQSFCKLNQICKSKFQLFHSYDPLCQLLLQRAKNLRIPLGPRVVQSLSNDMLVLLHILSYKDHTQKPTLDATTFIDRFEILKSMCTSDIHSLLLTKWNAESFNSFDQSCTSTVVEIAHCLFDPLDNSTFNQNILLLRHQTGAGYYDCLEAMFLADGDIVNAIFWLVY